MKSGTVLVLAALLVTACIRPPKQTAVQQRAGGDLSSSVMRTRVVEFTHRALSDIQKAADSISLYSTDASVRRNSLLWKINSTPVYQAAALQPDPVGAAGESYVLTLQMLLFFRNGPGRDAFLDRQPVALDALDEIRDLALSTLRLGFAGDSVPATIQARLDQWVYHHPLTAIDFERPSLSQDWPGLERSFGGRAMNATISRMEENMSEVNLRVAFATETLLKQVRWNVQLMAQEMTTRFPIDSVVASGTTALDRLGLLAVATPALIDFQRQAALGNIDSQRVATLRAVSLERAAVFAGLDQVRLATVADLRSERIATIAALDTLLAGAFTRSDELTDRVALRLAELMGILLVGTALLLLLFRRTPRPH